MITTVSTSPAALRDAFYALSVAKAVPDAEVLDDIIRSYPEHAEALTDFAIHLAVDAIRHGDDEAYLPDDPEKVSPEVSRAMSTFHSRVFELRGGKTTGGADRAASQAPDNPFARLDRAGFRTFAERMNANTVFVSKLRDRLIEAGTITEGFRVRAAEELSVPLELLAAHLAGQAAAQTRSQFYKADEKPEAGKKQSFMEAVRGSGLTEEQQKYLLAL
jgi:hypothetical protein